MNPEPSRWRYSSYSSSYLIMAAPRNLIGDGGSRLMRDEENAKEDDSPTAKRNKFDRFPLSRWEFAAAVSVFLVFATGLFCVYLTMPVAQYGKIKLPRSISDLRVLKDNLGSYANEYPAQFILGYCSTYIFMQTFMIPGTIFMSLLAGALFGVIRGLVLVVFNATAGASSCFFLSKLIGRPLVTWLWPDKLRFFQGEIAKRREKLLNYMLFLRITPTLPNLFINLASPIVDIPFHIFFSATLIGLIPASYITVRTVNQRRESLAMEKILFLLFNLNPSANQPQQPSLFVNCKLQRRLRGWPRSWRPQVSKGSIRF